MTTISAEKRTVTGVIKEKMQFAENKIEEAKNNKDSFSVACWETAKGLMAEALHGVMTVKLEEDLEDLEQLNNLIKPNTVETYDLPF